MSFLHPDFRKPRILLLLIFLISNLSACNSPRPDPLPTLTPITIQASPTYLATSTTIPRLSPTLTQTITPTVSPSRTDSPTPLPSATPTLVPTATATAIPPTPTPAPKAECGQAHGQVLLQQIESQPYGMAAARIYLPPCYSNQSSHRYPTLYLLHGMNNTDEQWDRLGVPAVADTLIRTRQIPPLIVVMPKEDISTQDPDDSTFDDWLINILVPWVDNTYATCAQRECRAIGGLSRGSGWAFRIGLIDWQTFGAIGAHSFSPFDGDFQNMDGWISAFSASQRPRLYIDIGIYDQAVPEAEQFEEKLTDLRFNHEWHLNDGAHNEDYWRAHVSDYLRWYTQLWR